MGNSKRCLVVLSSIYVIAFAVNLIPSIMFPDATIQPIHAAASGLLLVCMLGTCLLRNRVAKLLIMAILFASVTVFSLISFETYMYDIVLLDALFSIQYPLYILFVTPLFGLNFFLNVNPEYVSLLVFFIAILLLVIHEVAVTRFSNVD
ncbi:hypothetical protein EVJ33_04825 [Exiguobacterium sp. SL-10]|uniref:hypothetical protein n=1 Tax=Exiguobacterium sp. SL-10 TaxID=2510962 RepID=UPI0010409F31|nr:hypothetical protein [Exiguobacterium sp. SL-10]TCI30626.1 hypothetical protein EVJ33_04825 [Exiguobacterium sp. SL-10]